MKAMMLDWFDAREASEVATSLADEIARQTVLAAISPNKATQRISIDALHDLFRRADGEIFKLRLNFFKRAKFANSFKWRLLENGVARDVADEATHSLVLYLSQSKSIPSQEGSDVTPPNLSSSTDTKLLLARGNESFARGAFAEAAAYYRSLVEIDDRNPAALQNLGAALMEMGLLAEAEHPLRQAIAIKPDYAEAYCNLGIVLRGTGERAESEVWLRRALKLKPKYDFAEIHLGVTLLALGRLRESKARLAKVLKRVPRHAEAMYLMGHVARMEGRFDEAETRFRRALEIKPKMPKAWAALTGTRKMTTADAPWLKKANELVTSGLAPLEEVDLRFAMGKYCDDVGDFEQAFQNYRRANELLKTTTDPYEPAARRRFVDDMVRVYTHKAVATVSAGVSDSKKPIFVLGMPRSGTSLVEQIIASHPAAKGAGELGFCDDSMQDTGSDLRQGMLSEPARRKLADTYLRALAARAGDASRIVDKAPVNSDYVGTIYSVFPHGRVIYMRRDPIDTCLSCYFQHFSAAMNYTMDLSHLAHYYAEHKRLMSHWRAVLPAGYILDVPYAELVADQETWTRKIVEFLGLEWDERCLNFHETQRQVVTASYWQVRQKIYRGSVARWRNYEKYIRPLLALED